MLGFHDSMEFLENISNHHSNLKDIRIGYWKIGNGNIRNIAIISQFACQSSHCHPVNSLANFGKFHPSLDHFFQFRERGTLDHITYRDENGAKKNMAI